jgi:hypothetical protein
MDALLNDKIDFKRLAEPSYSFKVEDYLKELTNLQKDPRSWEVYPIRRKCLHTLFSTYDGMNKS